MDGARPAIIISPRIRLIFFLCWLAGCARPQPVANFSAAAATIASLRETVAALRVLPFKRDVALADGRQGGDNALERFLAEEYGAQPLGVISRTYKRLGLLPESVDFGAALKEFARLERSIYHDAAKDIVGINAEAAELASFLSAAPALASPEAAAVMALSLALQDQHFQWQERVIAALPEDRKLALRAVARGAALLTGRAYFERNRRGSNPTEETQAIARFSSALENAADSLPEMLKLKLVFPFRDGSQFVQWARASGGWSGVNALFESPPLSTAQVLHPEKYFVRKQNPLQITAWGLARR